MSIAAALREAAARLGPVSDTPRLDAELLMAHALGLSREAMLLSGAVEAVPAAFAGLVERRLAREPLAYILGRRGFWDFELAVGPAVLIPRPDSETLIEAARDAFAGRVAPERVLDLGTGSGALLLAALRLFPAAAGLGLDASGEALAVAERNARDHGLTGRARFDQRDWTQEGWTAGLGRFALILANPPYVAQGSALAPDVAAYEPAAALYAGRDGLDAYRRLMPAVPDLMACGGVAVFELGAGQAGAVSAMGEAAGLGSELRHDLGGHARALILRHLR